MKRKGMEEAAFRREQTPGIFGRPRFKITICNRRPALYIFEVKSRKGRIFSFCLVSLLFLRECYFGFVCVTNDGGIIAEKQKESIAKQLTAIGAVIRCIRKP